MYVQIVQTAMAQGYLKPSQCRRVNVDTTVQTKDVRFPTDARLYDRMRETLVKTAQEEGIKATSESGKRFSASNRATRTPSRDDDLCDKQNN